MDLSSEERSVEVYDEPEVQEEHPEEAPPPRSRRTRWTSFLLGAVVMALVGLLGIATWEVTNANAFCDEVCHEIMYPYVDVWQHSTHVEVDCVECHMGRTPVTDQLPRKFVHARELYALVTNSYEEPLEATTLRPARETCELCHYPPQFFADSVREFRRYDSDRENTPVSTWLIVKTGGGLEREGLGFGIHWHVENEIYFYGLGDSNEEIPWMRVVDPEDGEETIYAAVGFELPEEVDEQNLHLMDCLDCHNRVGHDMQTPEELVDNAIERGRISADIPYIRRQAVEAIGVGYETQEEGLEAIAGIEDWYEENYSLAYPALQEEIVQAIEVLQELYAANFFPAKGYNWRSYPDHTSHVNWPGCFRCHDGQHISADNEVVRIECNLCHSVPEVVVGGGGPTISLTRGPEPASHRETAWLHRHHLAFDETCDLCHTVADPGGTSNTSFCSNSACHGREWVYANLNAPGLAEQLGLEEEPEETPEPSPPEEGELTYESFIGALLTERCAQCHGIAAGLDVTTYESLMAGSDTGPVVIPGNPQDSPIVQVLVEDHFGGLDGENLDLLREWIASGAPEM
jgi:nitrate/TMAO reductase-like tetraheme cytochrome c subunit